MRIILGILIIIIVIAAGTQVRGYMTWRNMDEFERFAVRMDGSVDEKKVFGSVVKIESKDQKLQYETARGNLSPEDIFCAGSISKLYTATIIFQLVDEGMLEFTDTLDMYLTEEELSGLHYYDGQNYGGSITVEQLISMSSGMPDHYLEEVNGKSLLDEIQEEDRRICLLLSGKRSLSCGYYQPGLGFIAAI